MKYLRITSLTLFWTVFAYGGNEGSGYNGPITGGDSIPIHLDRAVSVERIGKAYDTCTLAMASDLAMQITKLPPKEFAKRYERRDGCQQGAWTLRDEEKSFSAIYHSYCMPNFLSPSDKRILVALQPYNRFVRTGGALLNGRFESSLIYFGDQEANFSTGDIDSYLPLAVFENTLKDAEYDELGNLVMSTVIAAGLRFEVPPSYQDEIVLYNRDTGHKTSLKLDVRSYFGCLYDEIQK